MKALELTNEHKSKLLEMCIKLFPEYKKVQLCEYQIDIDRNIDFHSPVFVDLYRGNLNVPFDIMSIHWFEFCITHLITKLHNILKPSTTITLMRGHVVQESDHPIDYLYEQFKKLKL